MEELRLERWRDLHRREPHLTKMNTPPDVKKALGIK
jgi:hypothetical protein